jgi:hypothetical protein
VVRAAHLERFVGVNGGVSRDNAPGSQRQPEAETEARTAEMSARVSHKKHSRRSYRQKVEKAKEF